MITLFRLGFNQARDRALFDDGVAAIGSGGAYALAAARALAEHTELSASEIAQAALRVAAGICIYTNENISMEKLP